MKCPKLGGDTEFDHPSAYKIPQAWRWDRNNSSKPIWNAPSLGATPNSIIQALMKCPKVGRAIEFTSSKPIYGHPSLVVFAIWHVFQTSNCICNDPSLYGRPNSSIQAYIRCYKLDVVTNFEHLSLYIYMMVMLNSGRCQAKKHIIQACRCNKASLSGNLGHNLHLSKLRWESFWSKSILVARGLYTIIQAWILRPLTQSFEKNVNIRVLIQ